MKKHIKFLIYIILIISLFYVENKYLKELFTLHNKEIQKEQSILKNIKEKCHPREKNFYKN